MLLEYKRRKKWTDLLRMEIKHFSGTLVMEEKLWNYKIKKGYNYINGDKAVAIYLNSYFYSGFSKAGFQNANMLETISTSSCKIYCLMRLMFVAEFALLKVE
ncbi:hypothetical protein GDO78_005900 [Eleutherodactylus coqui]|uniref:Uncharacterized protein n=1 Tax=Eleutherodactylus coqui TaxID=57060 RepID=A0A8J6KER2_ELECQ|nr:hypothetical protein GDO78_005900 [Eleutherodactylus coqui]